MILKKLKFMILKNEQKGQFYYFFNYYEMMEIYIIFFTSRVSNKIHIYYLCVPNANTAKNNCIISIYKLNVANT